MKPRQAWPEVAITGRTVEEIGEYLEDFTYTDPATGESDAINITLANADMAWSAGWMPKKGDRMDAVIRTLSWDKAGAETAFPCGTFCCDDLGFSFWDPLTASIGAVSVPEKQDFRAAKRSKTWEDVTVDEIAAQIAASYGLEVAYDADPIRVASKEQNMQEDSAFLSSLCGDYGLYIKVYSGRIIIYDATRYEARASVASIGLRDVLDGDYNSSIQGTYTGATIRYTNGSESQDEYEYSIGGGNRILYINEKVDSLEDARIKARAKLAEENRKAETMKLTLANATAFLRASCCIDFSGGGGMDGKYFIDKATHKLDASGGYTVALDLHKVQQAIG